MVAYYGDFPLDHVAVRIPFNTFDSNDPSESITITDLADADIKVHKDGATSPITTDGASVVIDINSITGNHIVLIDTSADAAYTAGSEYQVRVEGTTIDVGNPINAWIGSFSIERAGGVLALLTATTLASIKAETALIVEDTNELQVDDYPTSIAALQTDLDTLTAGVALTAAGVDAIWDEEMALHTTADTAGLVMNEWQDAGRLDAILDIIAADVVNVDGYNLATQIGTAGAGLTNLGASGNDWNTVTPDAAGVAPTAAEIETEVWDGLQSAHVVPSSMGILATEIAALQTDLDTVTAGVIVTTNNDKTGYSLTTADWNVGKTGYTLTATTGLGAQTANITGNLSGTVGSVTGSVGSNVELGPSEVNAQVLDVLKTDTMTQSTLCPQEAPPVNATMEEAIAYLYKAWRNRSTQTATTYSLYADDATTQDQKATVSDDATTADKNEVVAGT